MFIGRKLWETGAVHGFLLSILLCGCIKLFSQVECQGKNQLLPWGNQDLDRNLLTIQYFHNYSANAPFMAGVNNPFSSLIKVFSPSFVIVATWHGIATHSSIHARRIQWPEEPGGL